MNKLICTENCVFLSLNGPSEPGMSQLIYNWLSMGTFQENSTKFTFLSTLTTTLRCYEKKDNLEFVQCKNYELIDSLKNNGTKCFLIFDNSCGEIFDSKTTVGNAADEDSVD